MKMCPAAVILSPVAPAAPAAWFPTARQETKRCGRSVCALAARRVFPSVWKNNDAASEPRRRHSATHGLNGERRRDELSSFISSGRENTTGK